MLSGRDRRKQSFSGALLPDGAGRPVIDALNIVHKVVAVSRTEAYSTSGPTPLAADGAVRSRAWRVAVADAAVAAEMRDAGMSLGGHTVNQLVL